MRPSARALVSYATGRKEVRDRQYPIMMTSRSRGSIVDIRRGDVGAGVEPGLAFHNVLVLATVALERWSFKLSRDV